MRRKSGDFSQLRKHSESESEHLNGVTCNGDSEFQAPLSPGSEGSDSTDQAGDIVFPLPDLSQESDDPSNRYPLFIQVNNSAQAQNKPRIVKPVNRASNQGAAKQDNPQSKQPVRPRRSASFTAPRRPGESRPLVGAPNRLSQDTVKNGNLRREKSDIVRPHRTQSPVSAIPRPARSNSSSSLKQDNSTASPRSHSPAGLQREGSDVTKHRGLPGVRREKSDVARPRGQSRTNSPIVSNEQSVGDISRSSSNRSLTSNTLSKSPSKSSIEGSRSRSGSSSEMSKIPSLARSPANAEKPESHVSRIPSIAKQNGSEERTPPKSKIPSKNKGDKGQEAVKRSQIPTTGRRESASQKEKPTSKIPASSTLSQNRPDSAKENKDPTANRHEPAKQLSKIPSFGKSSIPKSKIPSVTRKESQNEEPSKKNGTAEVQSPVSDSTKSKIPGAVPAQQGTGIPLGISRIPSFTKATPKQDEPASNQSCIPTHPTTPANKAPESKLLTPGGSNVTEPDGPVVNQSRIPTIPTTPSSKAVESKLPTPGGSKTPTKSPPSSLPIAPKTSGIPKPGESAQGSRIPGYPGEKSARKVSNSETVQTGISSPVETKNKIPKLASMPKSNITNGNEQAGSKPKQAIPTLGGRQRSMEKESSSPAEPATPPSTPIRKDAAESPLDKYIFSEAKRMEQILRDEPIEVEVIDRGGIDDNDDDDNDDDEFLRQEREIEKLEEEKRAKGLAMLDSKEAEDLICEVLKSYAPDINKENQPELEDLKLFTEKDDNKNIREKVNIDDIVLQPAESGNQTAKEPQVQQKPPPKVDLEFGETVKEDTVDKKQTVPRDTAKITEEKEETKPVVNKAVSPGLKIDIPTERSGDSETEERTDIGTPKSADGPGIDTLGEYAQHARRSRSRQRKIVSPDSEEPEKEFVAEPDKEGHVEEEKKSEKEQPKKDIKKDKFGTAPFEGEKKPKEASKSTKSKSKNDKPKFVIESSLGKDFYATRKSNESVESRDSVHDDVVKSSFKPQLSALVFENIAARQPLTLKHSEAGSVEEAASLEEAQFVDVDLNSEPAIVKQRRELSRSVDDLDEKTVKCMCGRGGNCSIM